MHFIALRDREYPTLETYRARFEIFKNNLSEHPLPLPTSAQDLSNYADFTDFEASAYIPEVVNWVTEGDTPAVTNQG